MPSPFEQPGVTELVRDAVDQYTKLIRNELAIARVELAQKAAEAAIGAGMMLGGALLLIPAMVLLLMALAAWLIEVGLSASVSNLIAGVIGLLISGVFAWVGKAKLNPGHLKPKHTIRRLSATWPQRRSADKLTPTITPTGTDPASSASLATPSGRIPCRQRLWEQAFFGCLWVDGR